MELLATLFHRIERVDAQLASDAWNVEIVWLVHSSVSRSHDRQGRIFVQRRRRIPAAQIQRSALHDVGEKAGLAVDVRLTRLEEVRVPGRRQRLAMGGTPRQLIVGMRDDDRRALAPGDQARELGDELSLGSGVVKRISGERQY